MQCRQDNAEDVVKLLLSHGADVNAQDEKVGDYVSMIAECIGSASSPTSQTMSYCSADGIV